MKMTNKEAIEQVKTILKVRKEQKEIIECSSGNCINCNSDIEALEKVLNLIEKQQKEIEEKAEQIENLEMEHSLELIGKEEEIEANMREIIEKYYIPKEAIMDISNHIEYYLMGNLRYKDSQRVFEILLKKLKEILGE